MYDVVDRELTEKKTLVPGYESLGPIGHKSMEFEFLVLTEHAGGFTVRSVIYIGEIWGPLQGRLLIIRRLRWNPHQFA